MYWFAILMGSPGAQSPLQRSIFRSIAADEEASRMLFRVLNRDRRPSQLFTPGRALRGAAGALRREPRQAKSIVEEMARSVAQVVEQARSGRTPPPGMAAASWR
jgi:hypothetical protein